MVNRYWRQLRSKLFSGHRFISPRVKISLGSKAGSGERGRDVFSEEEKRRAGLRGELGAAEEPQPRTPARAGSAAAPLPRDAPGEPGMLCPGVLV